MSEGLEGRVLLAVVPAGEAFRVDPGGGAAHGTPEVSADADGDFVAVWEAERDFGEFQVFGRRYDAAGAPLGPAFQANQAPTGFIASDPDADARANVDVAVDADGDFVVVWEKLRPAPNPQRLSDVYARRFAAGGAARGGEFLVAPGTDPTVATAPGGAFVVAFSDVFARRYDADGLPLGDVFQVHTFEQDWPRGGADAAVGANGHSVITWGGIDYAFDYSDVFGRRFAPDGAAQGNEFVVTGGGHADSGGTVTVDAAGGFAVSYRGSSAPWIPQPYGYVGVRRYARDGTPGEEVEVSRRMTWAPSAPHIAGAPDGRFAVAWMEGTTAADARVMARWYDASGFALAAPVEVAATGTATLTQPGAAMDNEGDTVIVWRVPGGTPGAAPGIFARRYVDQRRARVGSITASPDPVLSGRPITLTATGVTDPDGTVTSVAFYRESNGVPGLQVVAGGTGGDRLLGTDSAAPYTLPVDTFGLAPGPYTYYAAPVSAAGVGDAAATVHTVLAGPSAPPAVAQVYVDGSRWTPAFRRALSDAGLGGTGFGYGIPARDAQLSPIPFAPVDRVSIRFTEDVDVGPGSLAVVGAGGTLYGAQAPGFAYDPVNFIATWQLERPITADRVRITVASGAPAGVRDFSGAALDGEWADGADAYPSGDGAAGGDFRFAFNVLQGDVNRNGRVDTRDFVEVWRRRYNPAFPNPARYSVFADVDGSGRIDMLDLVLVRNRLGRRLP
jgi:hypothetical protein